MLIAWPDGLTVVESRVELQRAVSREVSPYSLASHEVDFGGRRWRGSLTVMRVGDLEPGLEVADTFEAFLDLWGQPGNWTEVPWGRPAAPVTSLAFTSPAVADGALGISVASGALSEAGAGQFTRIGNRTYRLASIGDTAAMLLPDVLPLAAVIDGTPTLRAKLSPGSSPAASSVSVDRQAIFAGPWTLSIDEYVGS